MAKKIIKVAVIGSGISGLSSAYALLRNSKDEHGNHAYDSNQLAFDITVYEAENRLGGHTHTHTLTIDNQEVNVDSGFIVLNDRNYPTFRHFLSDLKVETQDTRMSFAVSMQTNHSANKLLEYAGSNLMTLIGGGQLALSPRHLKMLAGIYRFNTIAKKDLHGQISATNDLLDQSLTDYLNHHNVSQSVQEYYLLPMAAAIWSCPTHQIKSFPARTFLTFFDHHGLLDLADRPQWKTVSGGSYRYIDALLSHQNFNKLSGYKLVHAKPINQTSENQTNGVDLVFENGEKASADVVIFSSHSDQTFRVFDQQQQRQFSALGDITYGANKAYLHSDAKLLPNNRKLWSCWNYLSRSHDENSTQSADSPLMVSYWMNELQQLPCQTPIIVTLNPTQLPKPETTYAVMDYAHPVFDRAAVMAQTKIKAYQGIDHCYFAGAYLRYGFHEDGIRSGYYAAQRVIEDITLKV